jgi:hypothetical protein
METGYFLKLNKLGRRSGPFNSFAEAHDKMMSYPNPTALHIAEEEYTHCSNHAEVGELIQWTSAGGSHAGRVTHIDRDIPTADPIKTADYYYVVDGYGKGHYLNSSMMDCLKVVKL